MSSIMIQLKPSPKNSAACPECGSLKLMVSGIRFESVNVLADCTCTLCRFPFYRVLPVGHMVGRTLFIGKITGRLYQDAECPEWLSHALQKSHTYNRKMDVAIERKVFKPCKRVVILNALDYLYGHVLLKLYNAFYHLDHEKEIGLIIIIPKMFEWLIPKGCAEVWVVDLKLSELEYFPFNGYIHFTIIGMRLL